MTNARIPNGKTWPPMSLFDQLGFELLSTFVIWVSSLSGSWFVLEATPAHGSVHRLTFDTKTGLLIRETYSIKGGELDHEMQYDDYKEVDGVRVPFTFRSSGGENWTVRLKEVKNNTPIDDAKFDPPSE